MASPVKRKGNLSLSSSANLLAYKAVFGLLTKVRPPVARPIRLGPESRVLVFSTAGLGDALLDSAGINALASEYPGIRIHAVVHHRRTDIARHNPLLEKLHFLRKGPHAFLALWWRLRKHGPWDAVLYLSCHDPEARCLGYLLAPDATVGLAWRTEMPWLCARNIDDPGLRRAHLAVQAVRVAAEAGAAAAEGASAIGDGCLRSMGVSPVSGAAARCESLGLNRWDACSPCLNVSEMRPAAEARMVYEVAAEDRIALDRSLSGRGFPLRPGVIFQLGGGGGPYRDWPVEHFLKLAELAHAAGIGPVFLLGGPDHREKAGEFFAAAAGRNLPFFDVVGRLPLPQSAALLERSRCLVSTDTGIMHLAFALGTPTVALLHCSPGDARVGPLADRDRHVVIQIAKPAGYRVPSDASMANLRPEDVFPGLKELFFRNA
ncbi:MAG: glycosyltransferase family 9 protein [Verrucomicrobiota bacterium]